MEANDGAATGLANNVKAVRSALESAGVIFVEENGEGPGVRLRKTIPTAPFTVERLMKVVDEFERSQFEKIRSELEPSTLSAGLVLGRHPTGINLQVTGNIGPIGTIRLIGGTLIFVPDLENGRDWTPHDWLTPGELSRWVRETCRAHAGAKASREAKEVK
jgi:hypothetical protein